MLAGWKMRILGLLVLILGAMQSSPDFAALVGSHTGIITQIIGVLIVVLREVTTGPAGFNANTPPSA